MDYFAGLDVSLEETAICIVDDAGRIVREGACRQRAGGAGGVFRGLRDDDGTGWPGGLLADGVAASGLTAAGFPAICIEARQAKAAMGAMPNKTDRNDARGIAQIMRTGWYRSVHVEHRPAAPGGRC